MTYIYSPPPHPLPLHHLVPTSSPTRASALDTRVFPFSSVSLYFSVRSWYRLFIRSRSVLGTESSRAFCKEAILNVAISCKKKNHNCQCLQNYFENNFHYGFTKILAFKKKQINRFQDSHIWKR